MILHSIKSKKTFLSQNDWELVSNTKIDFSAIVVNLKIRIRYSNERLSFFCHIVKFVRSSHENIKIMALFSFVLFVL